MTVDKIRSEATAVAIGDVAGSGVHQGGNNHRCTRRRRSSVAGCGATFCGTASVARCAIDPIGARLRHAAEARGSASDTDRWETAKQGATAMEFGPTKPAVFVVRCSLAYRAVMSAPGLVARRIEQNEPVQQARILQEGRRRGNEE